MDCNGGFCKRGSEPSGSIKAKTFLTSWATNYWLYEQAGSGGNSSYLYSDVPSWNYVGILTILTEAFRDFSKYLQENDGGIIRFIVRDTISVVK
jgi:hypothetical protein